MSCSTAGDRFRAIVSGRAEGTERGASRRHGHERPTFRPPSHDIALVGGRCVPRERTCTSFASRAAAAALRRVVDGESAGPLDSGRRLYAFRDMTRSEAMPSGVHAARGTRATRVTTACRQPRSFSASVVSV